MCKKYIIDRLSEDIAVCEDENGARREFDASRMPPGAREGDCMKLCDGAMFVADAAETQRRREYMKTLLRRAQETQDQDIPLEETEE